jgi:NhaP-type Na+/H+ or K+/H+ antiporter
MTASLPGTLAPLAATAAAGLAFGLAYFAAVRRTASQLAERKGLVAAALTIGRFAFAIVFFVFAARLGAGPLLAALGGFLAARHVALFALRRPS